MFIVTDAHSFHLPGSGRLCLERISQSAGWSSAAARVADRGAIVTTRIPLLGRVALTTRYAESLIVLRDTGHLTLDGRQDGHKQSVGMRWWVPGLF